MASFGLAPVAGTSVGGSSPPDSGRPARWNVLTFRIPMRFFGRSLARHPRVGALLFVPLLAVGTTGCEFLKGRPDVDRVELTVAPDTIPEGDQAQAVARLLKDNGEVITTSKVKATYTTSNASIATVNPSDGRVTAIAPGTVDIIAESQGKQGRAPLVVVFAQAAVIVALPADVITPLVNSCMTITVEARKSNGQVLPGRKATFTPVSPLIATVTSTGDLTARVCGIGVGTTSIRVQIGTATKDIAVSVRPLPIVAISGKLQNGTNSVQIGEQMQIMLTAKDSTGASVVTAGRKIDYSSSNNTVATVSNTGVVTGVSQGQATITIVADGATRGDPELVVNVVQPKVDDVQWLTTNGIFRLGVQRAVAAAAFDSVPKQISRTLTYTSTDPSVVQITGLGLVTPRAVGTAKLIASVDNKADTLDVRVTPVPVAANGVIIDPITTTVEQGQVVTYRATVRDSLNNEVTDRVVRWRSSNNNAAVVDTPTGQTTTVRTISPATLSISAIVDNVVGATQSQVSGSADLTVTATPIARIVVTPATVDVRVGATVPISVATFDKNGKELLGRGGSIIARADDPSIASVALDALNAAVRGLKAGSTKITFYGVDAGLNPITDPVTITVNVSSQ